MNKETKIFLFVAVFFYTVLMLSFTFIFDFDGLYGQDAYDYLLQTKNFFTEKSRAGFWPPLYPFLGKVISLGFLPPAFALQGLSILCTVLTGWLLFRILKNIYPESPFAAIYIIGFFLLAPFVLRSGLLVMSDSTAVAMTLAALSSRFLIESGFKLPLVFLFAALAILTRYAVAPLLAPLLLLSVVEETKKKNFSGLGLALLLFLVPLLLNFFYWSVPEGSIGHNWLLSWSPANFFLSEFDTIDGHMSYAYPNILQTLKVIFHPGFCLPFLLLLPFFRPADFLEKKNKLFLLCFLVYALFLMGIPFQNDRFLLPLLPFWLLIAYPAFSRLMQSKAIFRNLLVPAAIVLSFFLIYRAMLPVVNRNKLEREIVEEMKNYQHQSFYAFDMDIALQGRGLEMNYINLWKNELDTFQSGALVLFNEEQFRPQWSGKNPMINYLRMKESGRLIFVRNFSKGWQLSRLR